MITILEANQSYGGGTFEEFYNNKRVNQIQKDSQNLEKAKEHILTFLHNYKRNVNYPTASDVTSVLGDWAWAVLVRLEKEDLIRFEEKTGYIFPGPNLPYGGNFVNIKTPQIS